MKNYIYTCKSWESLHSFLKEINQEDISFFLIFAPYNLITEERIREIHSHFKTEYIIVSSLSVLDKDEYKEGYIQCVSFSFSKKGSANIYSQKNISEEPKKYVPYIEDILKGGKTNLFFSTSSNVAVNILLDNIKKPENSVLVGAIASSNDINFNTRIVHNGKIIDDGFVIVQMKNVSSLISVSLGFIPVGPEYKVTKVHLNNIYELDGTDIYLFLERILKGTGLKPEDLNMGVTMKYLWNFPFVILDKNFGYASISRTPKEFSSEENALKFWGNFKKGDKVKISIGDPDDLIENTEMDIRLFKVNWIEKQANPDIIFNFYCVARYELMKGSDMKNAETRIYRRFFRSKLIAGLSTFGEIAPDKAEDKFNLYNQTSVLVVLWED